MQEKYSPTELESTLQKHWDDHQVYLARETPVEDSHTASSSQKGEKFYCVSMLPYPSGKLHMGHVRNYAINDAMARQARMQGRNVLMPMGWDAFGMPAENAALANGMPPAQWTYANIASMKKQMQALGLAIDWSREVATCDPQYYKWNQWLFLKMLKAGLAYKKNGEVNWDPVDQTVLANEQVIDGRGWRSGALVEKREIPMYYLRITQYADALLEELDGLGWPDRVKAMQRNWMGKSTGVTVSFPYQLEGQSQQLRVFTTRADTLFGVTFCAIAAGHPLATHLAKDNAPLQAFIEECRQTGTAEADIATVEKKGIGTGFYVQHPLTDQPVEVWIANYVLTHYGEGAVMGVPAHDERDFAFAKKYQLQIQPVITWPNQEYTTDTWSEQYGHTEGGMCIHSGSYDGLPCAQARDAITKDLTARGLGEAKTTWRLRDWGISRQRYWGTPIPIIHCATCGDVPVPEADLPVVLPEGLMPDGSGNPLAQCAEFVHCTCPQCGAPARRETDTMDTFVDSSWYFVRYTCPDAEQMVDERAAYWLPMDHYIGGIEHAILHLLYSRFWMKVMRDLQLITIAEPATQLLTQGMVLQDTFYRENTQGHKTWFNPSELIFTRDEKGGDMAANLRADGLPVQHGGLEKMSKSKNNGVDPQAIIDQYGADTARLFVLFAAPPTQKLEWSGSGVEGAHRFLRRLWSFAYTHQALLRSLGEGALDDPFSLVDSDSALSKTLRRDIHSLLKQVEFDYQRVQYNTVISASMKMLNTLEAFQNASSEAKAHEAHAAVLREAYSILLRILYPIVPHVTYTLWETLGYRTAYRLNLLDAPWPQVDEAALESDSIELVLQINGKVRGQLQVAKDATREMIERSALEHDAFLRLASGQPVKKVIVVPGRIVNIVV